MATTIPTLVKTETIAHLTPEEYKAYILRKRPEPVFPLFSIVEDYASAGVSLVVGIRWDFTTKMWAYDLEDAEGELRTVTEYPIRKIE